MLGLVFQWFPLCEFSHKELGVDTPWGLILPGVSSLVV